ncbi:plant invertase/pectin methylesterase inhibitor [Striga asiatica]|uniref:Plant invertase/pectin methylesterase inhibitor n=1 Tax=Striga asiatica TaxID=4170 RepID=A0A5A7QZT8_STRAF|nr:plant invertase/pectin methylesterase inhibitor [Striga asiatica]
MHIMNTHHSSHKHYLPMIFLIVILLTTFSNYASPAPLYPVVTPVIIDSICAKASNRTLCRAVLGPAIGRGILFNPTLVLCGPPIRIARSSAMQARGLAWSLEKNTNTTERARRKYGMCFLSYKGVLDKLGKAELYMHLKVQTMTKNVGLVWGHVESCDKELVGPPRDGSGVLEANGRIKDLCSIVLAVCDFLINGRK